jgi:hypothetical protein
LGRIPISLNINRQDGIVNRVQIVRSQFNACTAEVLFEPMKFRCSRDRHNPRLLGDQPRQRDLSFGRLLLLCNSAEFIDQRLVSLSSFGRKARNDVTEVCLIELRLVGDRPRQEPLTERAERNESDT